MKESYSETLTFVAGDTYKETAQYNNGDIFNADGNALIGAKIDTASLTVKVYCKLRLGVNVGFGPWHELLDESGTRVSTFDSSKVFQASLYNQEWWNKNHLGFKLKFEITDGSISGGEKIYCDMQVS